METIFKSSDRARVVFHYNRQHNTDRTIPAWVVKHKGKSYYVNHLESDVGFNTKETPTSPHTRGSLQFKGILEIINVDGIITAKIK